MVTVRDGANAVVGNAIAGSDGSWSVTLAGVTDGAKSYVATAMDAAGNSATSVPLSFVVATGTTAGAITERAATTGSAQPDVASGTLATGMASLTVTGVMISGASSGLPSVSTLLGYFATGAGNPQTGLAGWTFSAPDSSFDALAAGAIATLTYAIAGTDPSGRAIAEAVTITVTGSDDAPMLSVPAAQTATLGVSKVITGVAVSDPDTGASETVTITDAIGNLVASGSAGALIGGSGSKSLTISGTLVSVNAALSTLTYTASTDGNDAIAIAVSDGTLSASATIAESVTGTVGNRPPVVVTGSTLTGAVTERTQTSGSTIADTAHGAVLFTDANAADKHSVKVSSVVASGAIGGLPVTATLLSWFNAGALVEPVGTKPGSAPWTFSAADRSFDYLSAGQVATLTYTLTLADNHGGSTNQTVTVTVTGTNDAPTVSRGGTTTAQLTELAGVTGSTAIDSATGVLRYADKDLADKHSATVTGVSLSGATSGLANTASVLGWLNLVGLTEQTGGVAGSVDWAFAAADASFDYLSAGQSVALTYTVTIADNNGATVNQTVSVTVTGTNDAPVFVTTGAVLTGSVTERANTTNAGIADTANGFVLFTDADLADTHTLKISNVVAGGVTTGLPATSTMLGWLHAGAVTAPVGTKPGSAPWTFSAADRSFDYLSAGQVATLTYTLTLADNHGGSTNQTVTVTVTGTNDAPGVAIGGMLSATLPNRLPTPGLVTPDVATGSVRFHDADLADKHTASVIGVSATGTADGLPDTAILLSWLTLSGLAEQTATPGSVTWEFTAPDASFDFLSAGKSVTLAYIVEIADGHGGTLDRQVTVKINGVNYAPSAINHSGFTTDNWTPQTIGAATLLAGTSDPNADDVLSVNQVSGAVGGSVSLKNGIITFTPSTNKLGAASFDYRVSDGHGGTATAAVHLTTTLHTISGTAGGTITGGAIPALLDGSAGHETVRAGSAGDILVGGPGDSLFGGVGADTFAFHAGFGQETLGAFTASSTRHDTLLFDKTVFADWAHLLGATKQVGSDLVITLDPIDSLVIKNVALTTFASNDAKFI